MPYTHDGPPLYLAEDQTTVVAADDPRASYLLVAPGGTLPDATAKHYGLPRSYPAAPEPEPERPDTSAPDEQIDGQGLEPVQEKASEPDPAPEPEKAAAPKGNKVRAGTPSNKAQE